MQSDSSNITEEDGLTSQLSPPIPNDADGFALSFELEQQHDIRRFFDEHGYVVVRNVLSECETTATRDDFFSQFNPDEEASVTDFLSCFMNKFSRMGIMGIGNEVSSLSQLANRQNERVYGAFTAVYGDDQLIVDHDRMGAMRPTRATIDAPINEEYQTINNWLHLDCNPASGEICIGSLEKPDTPHNFNTEAPVLVQGLLSLSDAKEEDGGFLCVPGSHNISKQWAIRNGWTNCRFPGQLRPDASDPLQQHVKNIPLRAGSLVIWNQFTFHANHPNQSHRWRINQYVRMYPVRTTRYGPIAPNVTDYPEGFCMTSLGRKLFGIDKWEQSIDENGGRGQHGDE